MISYTKLPVADRDAITSRLEVRRTKYIKAVGGERVGSRLVLLVGDRPGPSAPSDPDYHHTPFYSTKHCSGWLNASLHAEGIPEELLLWINAYDRLGNPADFDLLVGNQMPVSTIALGGNAAKWLEQNGYDRFVREYHPQYWKRFHHGERYPLLDKLKKLTQHQ